MDIAKIQRKLSLLDPDIEIAGEDKWAIIVRKEVYMVI